VSTTTRSRNLSVLASLTKNSKEFNRKYRNLNQAKTEFKEGWMKRWDSLKRRKQGNFTNDLNQIMKKGLNSKSIL
jgi:hypothetical protein